MYQWKRDWNATEEANAPPTKLYVRVNTGASASGYHDPALQTSNGQGDPTVYETESFSDRRTASCGGTHLVIMDVDTTQAEPLVELPAVVVSASATLGRYGWEEVQAHVGYAATQVSWPIITSGDIETSFFKGFNPNHGAFGEGERIENKRNPDGSIVTDSAVWWDHLARQWAAETTYKCVQSAFPNPEFFWSLSGGTWQDSLARLQFEVNRSDTARTFLFFGSDLQAKALGQSTTISVTVREKDDSSSPVLSNWFQVRWHLPYENWAEWAPRKQVWEYPLLTVQYPGYAMMNGDVHATWQFHSYYWGATEEALSLLEDVVPDYGGLFAIAGFLVGQYGPQESGGGAAFNDCWEAGGSSYSPDKDDSKKNLYRMTPRLRLGYTMAFWDGEHYNQNGYTGQTKAVTKRFDGRNEWVGNFTRQEEPGPFPPGGGYGYSYPQ